MTQLKHGAFALITAAGLLLGSGVVAAQEHADHHDGTVGSTVTLTSCVEKAQNGDKYVLTHVVDVPAYAAMHQSRVVYWIRDVGELRPHVGHQVRLTGKITGIDKREMEVKPDDDTGGTMVVEIEGPGPDVKAKPGQVNVAAQPKDVPTTVIRLKIDKLDMMAANCALAK